MVEEVGAAEAVVVEEVGGCWRCDVNVWLFETPGSGKSHDDISVRGDVLFQAELKRLWIRGVYLLNAGKVLHR